MKEHPNDSGNSEKIVENVLERLRGFNSKELLSYAISNEMEEAKYYSKLAELAGKISIKALFLKMSEESKKHEIALRKLFGKLFPGEEPLRIDVPSVEVKPFYSKLADVEDYMEALRYCMESELLAKRMYIRLAEIAEHKETRELAIALASMEEEHYDELRKVYDLLNDLKRRKLTPRKLGPGGYLFTDNKKAKYFLLDFLGWDKKVFGLIREKPQEFLEMFSGRYEDVLWITKVESEEFGSTIHPEKVLEIRKALVDFLEGLKNEGKSGVIFIENVGYLAIETGVTEVFDFLFYLKDAAVLNKGYVIITAIPDAFDKREWAILTSEFDVIS